MAFCDVRPWTMTLRLNKASGVVERFTFNLNSDGTGTVHVSSTPPNHMSNLIWSCLSLGVFGGANARGLMTFLFRFRRAMPGGVVEMGAVATGLARLAGGATIFGGQLITFALDADVPAAGTATLLTLQPDTGDTGTGNGNQT